jgi:two-component system LytT family sensor kinase
MRVYAGWEHMGHFLVADPFILTDFIIYVLFVASFNISSYVQLIRQKEQDASRLEASLTESRLHALQMQVNPHFLFNTLNGISVLVQKRDFATAEEMIFRLSDFFRMTLEKRMDQRVPLEAEIELLDNYLAIEQMRFKDRLSIEKQIDRRTLSVPVPAMILQPLVENSLRHGINAIEGPGILRIRSAWLGDRILLEVADNGPGCAAFNTSDFREGVGLSNVRGRLQQLYGQDFVFNFNAAPGDGTVVRIELPALSSDIAASSALASVSAASPMVAAKPALSTGEV